MDKHTENFIRFIKRGDGDYRENAIQFMMKYTGSPRESYTGETLFRIVKDFFMDYIKSGDALKLLWHYFEHRRIILLGINCIKSTENFEKDLIDFDIDSMLSALAMTRIKDENGNYINGFTERKRQ